MASFGKNKILNFKNQKNNLYFLNRHHVFMESGHSYMGCDADFGQITQKLRGVMEVFRLETYVNIFNNALKNANVVRVVREDFIDCKKVAEMISIKKKDANNDDVLIFF